MYLVYREIDERKGKERRKGKEDRKRKLSKETYLIQYLSLFTISGRIMYLYFILYALYIVLKVTNDIDKIKN